MDTTTASLRRILAASVVALGACLAGCATAAPAAESHVDLLSPHVDAAVHRMHGHDAADRYVIELLIRARLADEALESRGLIVTRVHGR